MRLATDLIIVGVSVYMSPYLSNHYELGSLGNFLALALMFVWYFATKSNGFYDEYRSRNFSFEIVSLLKTVITLIICGIVILYLFAQNNIPPKFLVIYSILIFNSIIIKRYIVRKILHFLRAKGRNLRNIVIIGYNDIAKKFRFEIENHKYYGYRFIGYLDDDYSNDDILGKLDDLSKIIKKNDVDEVIITLSNEKKSTINKIIDCCTNLTVRAKIISDYFQFLTEKFDLSMFGRYPIVIVRNDKINELHYRFIKRCFDLIFVGCLCLTPLPLVFVLVILCQKIFNPGPIFYKSKRWGRNNKEFYCLKFRSMKHTPTENSYKLTDKNDNRITHFGAFLRKSNLDELPQLWNVIIGEMSLVGPRPHDWRENIEIKDKIDNYMWRHIAKPGLTGWAQVNGYRGGTKDLSLMQKRINYDNWYIENWTLLLDIQIIFFTAFKMLKGDPNAY